jgi:hypothetical protein
MSYVEAPELFREIDLPTTEHGRLHLAREAMGRYALLPLELGSMRPSSFAVESQNQAMKIGEQPFNLAYAKAAVLAAFLPKL